MDDAALQEALRQPGVIDLCPEPMLPPLVRLATAAERFVAAIETAVERLAPAQPQIEDVDEEEAIRRLLKEWDKYGEIPLDTFCGVYGIGDKEMVRRIWRKLVEKEREGQ